MPTDRRADYRLENAEIAQTACAEGITELGLAVLFGVLPETIASWIATIPEFAEAVRRGSDVADAKVEAALFALATGYHLKKTEIFLVDGKPVKVETIERLAPDPQAGRFWLRHRLSQTGRGMERSALDDDDKSRECEPVAPLGARRRRTTH
jgi:hypothetical protein